MYEQIKCQDINVYVRNISLTMSGYFCVVLAIVLLAGQAESNATSNCEQSAKTTSYLDLAIDMISKAKRHYPVCPVVSHLNSTLKTVDCEELLRRGFNKSGSYKIWPRSRVVDEKFLDVYCDMETDGGGWTVIQRRGNFLREKDYFFKDWQHYKSGFGDIEKDFWLGNDNIFALTNQRLYSVRFDLKDVEGTSKYALYDTFWIDDEAQKYTLHIKDYSGDAGDSMAGHDNMKFSTKDADHDVQKEQNCADTFKGGWWYAACHTSNLNGLYLRGKHDSFADGVNWKSWKEYHESLDSTEIKIRPKDFRKKPLPLEIVETPKQ